MRQKQAEHRRDLAHGCCGWSEEEEENREEDKYPSNEMVRLGPIAISGHSVFAFRTVMDDASTTHPPVRLHAVSSEPLSMKAAHAHVDEFLSSLKMRSTLDATVTAQLAKLSKALKEERARGRA